MKEIQKDEVDLRDVNETLELDDKLATANNWETALNISSLRYCEEIRELTITFYDQGLSFWTDTHIQLQTD
ncbi:hypothetical protein DPMN_051568 [Dreissena polymorpha]|uniref:Uncharacterized protein n=1 Tax=Dreissena polymorpha TaxID=45954 RepID=A0A9D4CI27_DREPO|nr:hypothetical protein DPMN_051568 [Dreissena polymorpha]